MTTKYILMMAAWIDLLMLVMLIAGCGTQKEHLMRQALCFISDFAPDKSFSTASAALAMDAKGTAEHISQALIPNKDRAFMFEKALLDLAEHAISPRRLCRAYRKLWNIRREMQAALLAEQKPAKRTEEEEIPF